MEEHPICDFDFTNCKKLKEVSIGNGTNIENMNGLKNLSELQVVALGNFLFATNKDISFEDMISGLGETYSTDSSYTGSYYNNFIGDISALKSCKNLRILNISHLFSVSSEEFLNLVKNLPNLEEIVGQEINNAGVYSDELVEYCEKNNIKHPFTERSKEIKDKDKEIIAKLITPDMDDKGKVRVLSEYVIDNMVYVDANNDVKKSWGEALYNATIYGKGLCFGYAIRTAALFTEAGIKTGKLEKPGHAFNYYKVGEEYYYIDLTTLDNIFEEEPELKNIIFSNTEKYMWKIDEKFNQKSGVMAIPAGAIKQIESNNKQSSNSNDYKVLRIIGVLMTLGIAGITSITAINMKKKYSSKEWKQEEYDHFYEEYSQRDIVSEVDEER